MKVVLTDKEAGQIARALSDFAKGKEPRAARAKTAEALAHSIRVSATGDEGLSLGFQPVTANRSALSLYSAGNLREAGEAEERINGTADFRVRDGRPEGGRPIRGFRFADSPTRRGRPGNIVVLDSDPAVSRSIMLESPH